MHTQVVPGDTNLGIIYFYYYLVHPMRRCDVRRSRRPNPLRASKQHMNVWLLNWPPQLMQSRARVAGARSHTSLKMPCAIPRQSNSDRQRPV